MNAVTYQVAMNMGTLTLEDIKEQVYLAQADLRSEDMIQYYKILNSNHVPLDQNLEFSVHLSSSFEYSFQINAIYPLIKNFILKGNQVYEQMLGLWLLIFYRLKERCFNFAAGWAENSIMIPYVTSFNTETLELLEQILNQYEWDDELQESIRTSVNDPIKYTKIWTTYYKLRILICDMWLKAVQYDYFYRESRGTGQYSVDIERDVFGTAKTTITEKQTGPVDSLEIRPYCEKCYAPAVIERRTNYVNRLSENEPDYPTAINTWEGYRIEYEKLQNFFEQFGIGISFPYNVSDEINPDFLEEYYKKLAPLRQIYHSDYISNIAPNDHMASLFIISDMDIKMQRMGFERPFFLTLVGFFIAWVIASVGFSVITEEILNLQMSDFMSRSIILILLAILIIGEVIIGKMDKKDFKKEDEYFENRRKKQIDYMKELFSGTLPLL